MSLGIDIDQSVDWLEDTYADDCKCESTHIGYHGGRLPDCTIVAEYFFRFSCAGDGYLSCRSLGDYGIRLMAKGESCPACDAPAADCWSLMPV